jgi:hypothetical protein
VIYDFKTRRRYAVNTAAREYVEYSLYDTLGFRVMELQNRVGLQAMLAAAKADAGDEHGGAGKAVAAQGRAGSRHEKARMAAQLFIGGIQLATWSEAGAKVSRRAAQFARFMRYAGRAPQLLDKLSQGGVIPQHPELCPQRRPHFAARYQRGAHDEPQAYDLKTYKREMSGSGLDAMFDRIAAMTPAQLTAYRAQYPAIAAPISASRCARYHAGQAGMHAGTGKMMSDRGTDGSGEGLANGGAAVRRHESSQEQRG